MTHCDDNERIWIDWKEIWRVLKLFPQGFDTKKVCLLLSTKIFDDITFYKVLPKIWLLSLPWTTYIDSYSFFKRYVLIRISIQLKSAKCHGNNKKKITQSKFCFLISSSLDWNKIFFHFNSIKLFTFSPLFIYSLPLSLFFDLICAHIIMRT